MDIAIFTKLPLSNLILTLITIVLFVLLSRSRHYFQKGYGPWGIPLLGIYPFLRKDFYTHLAEYAKKYGDTYLYSAAGNLCLHVGNHNVLREIMINNADCFQHRNQGFSVLGDLVGKGFVFMKPAPWKIWRKFVVQSMRELGINPKELKGPLLDALKNTLQAFEASKGKPIDVGDLLAFQSTEVVRRLMLGEDVSLETASELNKLYADANILIGQKEVLLSTKFAKYFILPWSNGYKELYDGKKKLCILLQNIIDEHRKNFDPDNVKDLVDYYLKERIMREKLNDGTAHYFKDNIFIETLIQVYGDGGFTIGGFITCYLKEIASKPDLQNAMYDEINREIGTERPPVYEDRNLLPFTCSVLKEIERKLIFFPVVPSLVASRDITVADIKVPKDTIVTFNLFAIHNDPKIYKDPDRFDPNRFMEQDKTPLPLPVTFGIGKRACAGEILVRLELFVFFVSIVQHFTLHTVSTNSKSEERKGTDLLGILEEKFIAKPRLHN